MIRYLVEFCFFRLDSMLSSNLDKLVPTKYGWHVNFDKQFDSKWRPFSRPRVRQLVEYIPLFMRLDLRINQQQKKKKDNYCL